MKRMLRLTAGGPIGRSAVVELDGVDISQFLNRVEVVADAGGMVSATLHYVGAVVVEVDAGRVGLVKAPVMCDMCAKTVRGEIP